MPRRRGSKESRKKKIYIHLKSRTTEEIVIQIKNDFDVGIDKLKYGCSTSVVDTTCLNLKK